MKIEIELPDHIRVKLEILSKEKGLTCSEYVSDLVGEYVIDHIMTKWYGDMNEMIKEVTKESVIEMAKQEEPEPVVNEPVAIPNEIEQTDTFVKNQQKRTKRRLK